MKLTRVEQETIILWNEGESAATIYTHNEKLKARFAEYARQNPDKVSCNFIDDAGALHCEFPKSELRVLFRQPRSEKQMQASRESARKMRERLQNAPGSET